MEENILVISGVLVTFNDDDYKLDGGLVLNLCSTTSIYGFVDR